MAEFNAASIGMLTPSYGTRGLNRSPRAICNGIERVDATSSVLPVTRIALGDDTTNACQFDTAPMLGPAAPDARADAADGRDRGKRHRRLLGWHRPRSRNCAPGRDFPRRTPASPGATNSHGWRCAIAFRASGPSTRAGSRVSVPRGRSPTAHRARLIHGRTQGIESGSALRKGGASPNKPRTSGRVCRREKATGAAK